MNRNDFLGAAHLMAVFRKVYKLLSASEIIVRLHSHLSNTKKRFPIVERQNAILLEIKPQIIVRLNVFLKDSSVPDQVRFLLIVMIGSKSWTIFLET